VGPHGLPLWLPLTTVLSHVSEEGDTSEIDVVSISILTHVATYIRGKVIDLGDSYYSQALRISKL
jgi:hypothetical protein